MPGYERGWSQIKRKVGVGWKMFIVGFISKKEKRRVTMRVEVSFLCLLPPILFIRLSYFFLLFFFFIVHIRVQNKDKCSEKDYVTLIFQMEKSRLAYKISIPFLFLSIISSLSSSCPSISSSLYFPLLFLLFISSPFFSFLH